MTLLFALTAVLALYAAYAQHDARKAAKRAEQWRDEAESALTTAAAIANSQARWSR